MIKTDGMLVSKPFLTALAVSAGGLAYVLCNAVNAGIMMHLQADMFMPIVPRAEEYLLYVFGLALFPLLFMKEDGESGVFLKNLVFALLVCFVILNFGHMLRKFASNVANPRQWDFFDFYITGKVAAARENIYSPELFRSIPLPVPPRKDFITEVLDVGSKYPPHTSLFFALFGFFPFTVSLILFTLVQFVFFVLSGFEIAAFVGRGKRFALVAFALLFMLAGTMKSMEYLAPTFIVIYLVLRSLRVKSGVVSGFLLGLAILFRPFFLILFLDYALRKRFKHMLGVVIAIVATSLLSLAYFGPQTWMNYFIDGPFSQVPVMGVYSNYTFCSLNAFLLRTGFIAPIWGSPFFHPITLVYVAIAVLFMIFVLVKRPGSVLESLAFLAPWALFLYPETWWSYTAFLIFTLMYLYMNRETLSQRWLVAIGMPIFALLNELIPTKPEAVVAGLFAFAAANSAWILLGRREAKGAADGSA